MERRPLWLWPNLLSLDAPLVAVVWVWMFAKTWRVVWYPDSLYLLVGLSVWIIYVVDRLLDSGVVKSSPRSESPRHQFHQRHSKVLWVCVILAAIACLVILATLPTGLWSHGAMILVFVVGYFVLVFLQTDAEISVAKNIVAGMAFAYGTSVGVHFWRPDSNLFWFLFAPEALAFGVLCILNITAIDVWASPARQKRGGDPEDAREVLLSLLPLLLFIFSVMYSSKADEYSKPFFLAVGVSAAMLYLVDRLGGLMSKNLQRVLADVVMVVSVVIYFFNYPF